MSSQSSEFWFDSLPHEILIKIVEGNPGINVFDDDSAELVIQLDLSGLALREIPVTLLEMRNLRILDLSNNEFKGTFSLDSLPGSIVELNLSFNLLEDVTVDNHSDHKALKILHLASNKISSSFRSLTKLRGLSELDLSDNLITEIGEDFRVPPNLKVLNLSKNKIFDIAVVRPHGLTNCRSILLDHNALKEVPRELFSGRVKLVSLTRNKITTIDIDRNDIRVMF